MPLVECVANVSEGRDAARIQALADAITAATGCFLLHRDSGASANRTVFTFVGEPDAVLEGAEGLFVAATELIDMRKHSGVHPRIGAVDVCPFVPLDGCDMDRCVELARRLGERVGSRLSVPVFLYGEAAVETERRNLPHIRRGQYEGLERRMQENGFHPDFGPSRFVPGFGAAAIGAREILVAYNVNLDSADVTAAKRIAARLRAPGRLGATRAIGWFIEEYGHAQVSMNLLDYHSCSIQDAFDAVETEATAVGIELRGSEIVGLLPRAATEDLLVEKLGLDPSDLEQRILETAIQTAIDAAG